MRCFKIEKWGLVYQEIGKDKVVNDYKLGEILLNDDKKNHVMRSYSYNITITFYLLRKLYWAYVLSILYGIWFIEWLKKPLI